MVSKKDKNQLGKLSGLKVQLLEVDLDILG